MPPAKRSSSAPPKSSSASKPAAKKSSAAKTTRSGGSAAASAGAKSTATTARKASARTTTQAKSGATKTSRTAKRGAASTTRAGREAATAAGAAVTETAKAASAGAKGTATAARSGAKATSSRAKAANTRTKRASGGDGVVTTAVKNAVTPRDTVELSREHIQETLDAAASRGRVTRKDANDLVAELMRRGRQTGDEVREELGEIVGKIESATKRVRKAEPVDRIVRGADRARRAAGVGPTFPILGYDELNAPQIQARVKELSRPDQRKVLNYERRNANRKSVVGALEKSLA